MLPGREVTKHGPTGDECLPHGVGMDVSRSGSHSGVVATREPILTHVMITVCGEFAKLRACSITLSDRPDIGTRSLCPHGNSVSRCDRRTYAPRQGRRSGRWCRLAELALSGANECRSPWPTPVVEYLRSPGSSDRNVLDRRLRAVSLPKIPYSLAPGVSRCDAAAGSCTRLGPRLTTSGARDGGLRKLSSCSSKAASQPDDAYARARRPAPGSGRASDQIMKPASLKETTAQPLLQYFHSYAANPPGTAV